MGRPWDLNGMHPQSLWRLWQHSLSHIEFFNAKNTKKRRVARVWRERILNNRVNILTKTTNTQTGSYTYIYITKTHRISLPMNALLSSALTTLPAADAQAEDGKFPYALLASSTNLSCEASPLPLFPVATTTTSPP